MKNEKKDLGSCAPPKSLREDAEARDLHSAPYDLRSEAQRIIDAIEPRAGATMTLMCALHEAWMAGTEHRMPAWRLTDDD
jgi:hypothetical protein